MIKANIVFKDEDGQVVPQAVIDDLPPAKFFSMWSKGELRRDIAVVLEDRAAVEKGLKNWKYPEFRLVGAAVFDAWSELHHRQLSLTGKCLAHWEDSSGGGAQLKIRDSHDPVIAPEVKEVKRSEVHIEYHTTYYWLQASLIRGAEWYTRDPEVVVYDMIIELLNQWTMRDNATLLCLLKQADTINKPETYKDFTPTTLSHMITQVSRWAIPVPHFIATAEVFAQLDDPDWKRFMSGEGEWGGNKFLPSPGWKNVPQQGLEHGKLLDLGAICIGSPHDAFYPFLKEDASWPDIYLVGMPATLGVRAIHTQPQSLPTEVNVTGEEQRGWLWSTYIGTAVLNAKASVVGYFKKDIPEAKKF